MFLLQNKMRILYQHLGFPDFRFQGDDHPYPRHPPLVCFHTGLTKFPKPACLNITKRLMEEAKALARDEAPSVFALVSLLENR